MSSFRSLLVIFLSIATLVFGSDQPKARIVRSIQTGKRNTEVQYHVQVREKGVHFNETMRINTKENTVFFSVPSHNDVGRSEVLMDYNLNLTITRLTDLGICHVKPLDRQEPSPNKMVEDMEQIPVDLTKSKRPGSSSTVEIQFHIFSQLQRTVSLVKVKTLYQYSAKGKASLKKNTRRGIISTSSEWAMDKLLQPKDLSLSVRRFCAGLVVYSLKKIDEDDVVVEEQLITIYDGKARKKRTTNYQLCNRSYGNKPCDPDRWIMRCKFVRSGSTCVYWITCQLPAQQLDRHLQNCGARHDWSSVLCCEPVCHSLGSE